MYWREGQSSTTSMKKQLHGVRVRQSQHGEQLSLQSSKDCAHHSHKEGGYQDDGVKQQSQQVWRSLVEERLAGSVLQLMSCDGRSICACRKCVGDCCQCRHIGAVCSHWHTNSKKEAHEQDVWKLDHWGQNRVEFVSLVSRRLAKVFPVLRLRNDCNFHCVLVFCSPIQEAQPKGASDGIGHDDSLPAHACHCPAHWVDGGPVCSENSDESRSAKSPQPARRLVHIGRCFICGQRFLPRHALCACSLAVATLGAMLDDH